MKILVGQIQETSSGEITQGLEIGTDASDIQITSVQGLETAPIRNNYNSWSGKDGGYMSSQLYAGREITIEGFYIDSKGTCFAGIPGDENYQSVRERISSSLRIRQLYPIFFQLLSGKIFYTEGYLIDLKMDFANYKTGDYSMTFYCPSYELSIVEKFGDTSSVWNSAALVREGGGGHLVPETLPVLFEAGTRSTVIDYQGSLPSYPKIELKGPLTAPIVVLNSTFDKWIQITTNIEDNSSVVIDMDSRQVLRNGTSISYYIDSSSSWWYLEPGQNRIYVSSASDSDNMYSTISWRNNVSGF